LLTADMSRFPFSVELTVLKKLFFASRLMFMPSRHVVVFV